MSYNSFFLFADERDEDLVQITMYRSIYYKGKFVLPDQYSFDKSEDV